MSTHRSTSRVLDVLELVSSNTEGFTLTEISTILDAPKSSMFPIIHTLLDRKYISIDKNTSKYKIGSAAYRVGSTYLDHFSILDTIKEEMEHIVNVCSETCQFGILRGGEVLYLLKVDSPEAIRMISHVGKLIPAYCTALGKSLLCDCEIDELKKIYSNGLKPLTENSITDFSALYEQLKKVRVEDISYEYEECTNHISCIAVPIRKDGKVVAALSISIPTFRITSEKNQLISHLLLNSKNRIEKLIKDFDINIANFS
ncbi:transcriptional regulator KdgR [Clostridium aceticum]|uniref:Transcriptional regulator KdgR n=1 Tax=Clostridium aceticum TaxID=84022 RepID=A0A0D8ICQ2_9CLOT|nr:IclR family transcriptional regulator [Clostridium aceticum]AKL94944.1 transcriptional regulator KdgR [Clostridium aceticum]KJF27859.1 IclR family transcriptional regulator [Clostridium aceticum]